MQRLKFSITKAWRNLTLKFKILHYEETKVKKETTAY